jgi:hypothetical protein
VDTATKVVNALLDHWALLVGMAVITKWGFPWAIKAVLLNGGGDTIRKIVKEENAAQSAAHAETTHTIVTNAIRNHEIVEEASRRKAFLDFEHEITDRYSLTRRPNRNRKGRGE